MEKNKSNRSSPLVDHDWASERLEDSSTLFVEVRMKPVGADDNWESGLRIPGAVLMDVNRDFSEAATDLPHMLPSEAAFESAARRIGINQDSTLVLYDQVGTYGSARGWWMLRAMGHPNVHVLSGGLPVWRQQGLATETADWADGTSEGQPSSELTGDFVAKLQPELVRTAAEILAEVEDDRSTILDARSQGRFDGVSPEPRAGLVSGHIPGSTCLPWNSVLDGYHLKKPEVLRRLFTEAIGSQPGSRVTMTCGSGVTAAILALAYEVSGLGESAVYDGSWAEWGQKELNFPVATANS
jgi:thiosulfate/3-mercaptopyruvate sulfurtransferase